MSIVVLGSGRIGGFIANELSKNYNVVVLDKEVVSGLSSRVKFVQATSETKDIIYKDAKMVVNCVPGRCGFDELRKAIECGCNVVDISFMSQDPFSLNELAKEKKVSVVVDAGFAPGLTNMLVSHAITKHDIISAKIMVGCIPQTRTLPWEYSWAFSPDDVMEEYVRPVRVLIDGAQFTHEPLSNNEAINVPEIGTLEAFETDGLRTLLHSVPIDNISEKTIRYPGYCDKIKFLRNSGFLDTKQIINGVSPMDMTKNILNLAWQKKEKDMSIMEIIYETEDAGIIKHGLIDRQKDDITSISKVTGHTCIGIINAIKGIKMPLGILAPEDILSISEDVFTSIMLHLYKNKIMITGID